MEDKEHIITSIITIATRLGKFPTKRTLHELDFKPSYSTLLRMGIRLEDISEIWKKEHCKSYCLCCGVVILSLSAKKFCCRKCAAKYNNSLRTKHKEPCVCKNCGIEFRNKKSSHGKFCSTNCASQYRILTTYTNWCSGEYLPSETSTLYNLLIRFEENKCSICGISEWNNKPLRLEVEHIDGNSDNNTKSNICLICPNCHSQTDTYKGKNIGNGRYKRRQRYLEGKSF